MKPTAEFRIINELVRNNAANAVMKAPLGNVVKIQEESRSSLQNSKLWPMLQDISRQVKWPITITAEDGSRVVVMRYLNRYDWKTILTASLRGYETVQGIDGVTVALGQETSKMGKQQFSLLIEFIYAFGGQHGVIWSEKSIDAFGEYL